MGRLSTPYREKVIDGLEHCAEDGCKGCPYEPDCKMADGFSELAKDALELLMPRVLTLQECYEAPFVWLEEADGIVEPVVRKVRQIAIEPMMLTISRFDGPMRIERERDYGLMFRCWNQYPSDKYREAAKWG